MDGSKPPLELLEDAFDEWHVYLTQGGYETESTEEFFKRCLATRLNGKPLKAALFDSVKFPSLAEIGIEIASSSKAMNFLPKTWEPSDVAATIHGNPLAQFLLGYIWKLGKYREVGNVIAGFSDSRELNVGDGGETAVVMRQFGRHLASPTSQPIFDQHTARFLYVYRGRSEALPFGQLVVEAAGKEWSSAQRDAYIDWWLTSPICWLSPARQIWADRVMFSLGKAVKILGRRSEGKRSATGRRPRSGKVKAAEALMREHESLSSEPMRRLLMNQLNIGSNYANALYYRLQKRIREEV